MDIASAYESLKDFGINFLKSKLSGITVSQSNYAFLVIFPVKFKGLNEDVALLGPKILVNSFSIVAYSF